VRKKAGGPQAAPTGFLYHYFERDIGPFRSFTELPVEEARQILIERKAAGKPGNPDIEGFLQKRYDRDEQLRDLFIQRGGKPERTNPYYMFLGPHRQWRSAYDHPECVKIPLGEFDPLTVSFTYGDSFAALNPALFGPEEYWGKVYFAHEILDVIARHGLPPHAEYNFKRGVYPKANINNLLKYVEAHVWSEEVVGRVREEFFRNTPNHNAPSDARRL